MRKIEEIAKNLTGEAKALLDELVHSFAETIKQKNDFQKKIEILTHQNRLLKKTIYGSKSEKTKDIELQADLPLFNEFELVAQILIEEFTPVVENITTPVTQKPRKTTGRKPLPTDLPRTIIEHDLSDQLKQCHCEAQLQCIGTQVSEELEYVPAKLQVIEHRCKKYICACCVKAKETQPDIKITSRIAEKPAQLIPKSFASPGLLAHIATAKFCDHLPLYRQESIFQRVNINLSRQTMSGWMSQVGQAILPPVMVIAATRQ